MHVCDMVACKGTRCDDLVAAFADGDGFRGHVTTETRSIRVEPYTVFEAEIEHGKLVLPNLIWKHGELLGYWDGRIRAVTTSHVENLLTSDSSPFRIGCKIEQHPACIDATVLLSSEQGANDYLYDHC